MRAFSSANRRLRQVKSRFSCGMIAFAACLDGRDEDCGGGGYARHRKYRVETGKAATARLGLGANMTELATRAAA